MKLRESRIWKRKCVSRNHRLKQTLMTKEYQELMTNNHLLHAVLDVHPGLLRELLNAQVLRVRVQLGRCRGRGRRLRSCKCRLQEIRYINHQFKKFSYPSSLNVPHTSACFAVGNVTWSISLTMQNPEPCGTTTNIRLKCRKGSSRNCRMKDKFDCNNIETVILLGAYCLPSVPGTRR